MKSPPFISRLVVLCLLLLLPMPLPAQSGKTGTSQLAKTLKPTSVSPLAAHLDKYAFTWRGAYLKVQDSARYSYDAMKIKDMSIYAEDNSGLLIEKNGKTSATTATLNTTSVAFLSQHDASSELRETFDDTDFSWINHFNAFAYDSSRLKISDGSITIDLDHTATSASASDTPLDVREEFASWYDGVDFEAVDQKYAYIGIIDGYHLKCDSAEKITAMNMSISLVTAGSNDESSSAGGYLPADSGKDPTLKPYFTANMLGANGGKLDADCTLKIDYKVMGFDTTVMGIKGFSFSGTDTEMKTTVALSVSPPSENQVMVLINKWGTSGDGTEECKSGMTGANDGLFHELNILAGLDALVGSSATIQLYGSYTTYGGQLANDDCITVSAANKLSGIVLYSTSDYFVKEEGNTGTGDEMQREGFKDDHSGDADDTVETPVNLKLP